MSDEPTESDLSNMTYVGRVVLCKLKGSRDLWIGRVVLRYATASGPVSVMDHRRLRGPVKHD